MATLNNLEDSTGEEHQEDEGALVDYIEDYDEDCNDYKNRNDHLSFNNFVEEGGDKHCISLRMGC